MLTLTEQLRAAEAALDRLLQDDPPPAALIALAYEAECNLREREAQAVREREHNAIRRDLASVRPWQLPLAWAWGPIAQPARTNQYTGRFFCKNGHEFTPENTLHRKDGRGRECRKCKAQRMAKFERSRKAKQLA